MRIFLHGKTERKKFRDSFAELSWNVKNDKISEDGFILLRSLLVSVSVLLALCAVLLVFAHTLRTEASVLKNARNFVRDENVRVLQIINKGGI